MNEIDVIGQIVDGNFGEIVVRPRERSLRNVVHPIGAGTVGSDEGSQRVGEGKDDVGVGISVPFLNLGDRVFNFHGCQHHKKIG